MYSETDNPNHSSIPSADRLDPLQNPLLNQHMGRWAEVYCTTPPDQREQAVSELLRELEAEEHEHPTISRKRAGADTARTLPSSTLIHCPFCGYANPDDNVFCGACRAQLRGAPTSDSTSVAAEGRGALTSSSAGLARTRQNVSGKDLHSSGLLQRGGNLSNTPISSAPNDPDAGFSADAQSGDNEYNDTDEANGADSFHFSSYNGRSSSSYRFYIGIVLALIMAFLVYRAWRSTKSAAEEADGPPRIPPVATSPNTASRAPSAQPTASSPAETTTDQPKVTSANTRPPSPPPAENQQPSAEANAAPTPTAHALSAGGSAELSLAKNYLNGTDGKARNPSDAVSLLWEAVGKKNAEATELLANAYLTGQGVSKNCDQARVLLDAAARKGRKDAGERLRHLQAFGCQ